ncbi:putative sterigmatocystin biosynthesis monooxygenase stcF [Cyphellophora attinorum]|uniref:Putative sterigmatocystin biosynthesis monooxygenase stcF n=1 Tax=Cyphellophora attinorum TaxID=1664694 RepID=A0A0N0NRY4_9EURO|nr:putative sterigmatocystin biosynthesis monooxygenase stcF [Phialophora attinorum]KPI45628.1 putative sterigmatocystin biosynthesis monooxygenase stcF [Phialophora attinorum]
MESLPSLPALLAGLSVWRLLLLLFAQVVTFVVAGAIYRLYLHPLAKYKGPKLFALTNLVQIRLVVRGEWVHRVLELHKQYGPIVRVAPNEISYVNEDAWNDIYKSARGEEQLKKAMPVLRSPGVFGQPDDAVHQMKRKKLSPLMSDRGVNQREDVMLSNIAFFVKRLKEQPDSAFDLTPWYQAVTSDIIGHFMSKESFGAVAKGEAIPEQPENHKQLAGLAIGTAFSKNFFLRNFLVKRKAMPEYAVFEQKAKKRWDKLIEDKGRIGDGTDAFGYLTMDMNTEKGLTSDRAFRVFSDFVLAGTDTVAISLLGLTYLLLRNPRELKILQEEVRSTFNSADDITLARVNALKYQNACISEGLRLWPAGPETTRRTVNKGGKVIAGEHVPAGTHVGVYHWVAGRYPGAWKDAESFVPERWLPGGADHKDDLKGVIQPFNVGPRNCVGQQLANAQLRLILANMIWYFDMALDNPNEADWMDVKIFGLVAVKKPLMVKLTSIR